MLMTMMMHQSAKANKKRQHINVDATTENRYPQIFSCLLLLLLLNSGLSIAQFKSGQILFLCLFSTFYGCFIDDSKIFMEIVKNVVNGGDGESEKATIT